MGIEMAVVAILVLFWTGFFVWQVAVLWREEIARHERYVHRLLSDVKRLEDRIHAKTLTDYAVLRGSDGAVPMGRIQSMDDETEAQLEALRR